MTGERVWPAATAAVCASAMVGTMPLVARQLYAAGLSAPSMLFWRYLLAVVVIGLAARFMRLDLRREWQAGAWQMVLLGATLGTAQTLCFWESLKTLETGIAVLLFYTYPALTLLLDRIVFKRPIRPLSLVCIAGILCGAALITVPGLKGGTINPQGLMWALPSPLIYAAYLAINSRLLRRHPPLIGAGALFTGMALTFALAAMLFGLDVPESGGSWLLVLFIALGPGALTMTLFSYAVPRLGASSFAILANVELVTVVAIGILVLGEAVTPGRVIGGGLIVAGILTHALARKEALPDAPALPRLQRGLLPPPQAGEGLSAEAVFSPPPLAGEGRGGGYLIKRSSRGS